MDLVLEEGDVDPVTCVATARREARGRAAAVVRRFVYALRVRPDQGAEKLVMILPHASFVATSGDPTFPFDVAHTGSFTRLTLSLANDSSASATLRVSRASMRLWSTLRSDGVVTSFEDPTPIAQDMLVHVEVSRQAGVTLGSLSFAPPAGAVAPELAPLLAAAEAAAGK